MLRIIPFIIVCILALACAAEAIASEPVCHEDEPCWTWSKMGNLKRGVTIVKRDGSTAHRVVGVCRFQRLARRGALDSSTPRLRGDRYALNVNCG